MPLLGQGAGTIALTIAEYRVARPKPTFGQYTWQSSAGLAALPSIHADAIPAPLGYTHATRILQDRFNQWQHRDFRLQFGALAMRNPRRIAGTACCHNDTLLARNSAPPIPNAPPQCMGTDK